MTHSTDGPVLIVGAGIAGLTAALALARRGLASIVLERAAVLTEAGAGIQLSPNASRILIGLGLGPALERTGVHPEAVVIRDAARAGAEIARIPLGRALEARYGAPYLVIHRADLQAALVDAVCREPAIRLVLGAVVETVADRSDGVTVEAYCGAGRETIAASALIGADGVWSTVRSKVLGGSGARFSGRSAWRATVGAAGLPGGLDLERTTGLWLGPRAHLVHYPISAGEQVNLVACVQDDWIDERWDVPGDPADLATAFRDWPPVVRDLLARPTSWRKWALCGAPDDTRWTRGAVALMGDAAHAMLPFVAQGGAMAIEDAAVLARHLATPGRPAAERLKAYAAERRPRALAVVQAARKNGSTYHMAGLPAAARNLVMRALGPERLRDRMDWIWGWKDAA